MREILFRGKRKDNSEWIEGYYADVAKNNIMLTGRIDITETIGAEVLRIIPETVGQYIGATDKNGKKIFEGDIVKFGNNIYEIKFIEKYSRFAGTNERCVFASFLLKNSEIIGNVHDNPELMDDSTADEDELAEEGD